MKLVTFDAGAGAEVGLVRGDDIVSISRALPAAAPDMIGLIRQWPGCRAEVEALAASGDACATLGAVHLLPPVPRPGKIMAIGLNYADHIAESHMETPAHQVWFTKAVTSANGPFDGLQVPKASPALDYEAEMVAVIGTGGRHISREDAASAIFGYCSGNDGTERAWQHRTPQWSLGKSFDTHAPFGPWITTADEAGDPHNKTIRCWVNGELRQDSNTRHLVFDVWDQIAHLSQAMTLEPGDLIFTGTPGGVGAAMNPRQFLKAGDLVKIEIEGLGAIENPVVAES